MNTVVKEAQPIWSLANHIAHLSKLLEPEVIGFFKSFEVTEILGFHKNARNQPVNFFTLLVAEPTAPPPNTTPVFLNSKRICLGDTQWSFGVVRYRIAIQIAKDRLEQLDASGTWAPDGVTVKVGALAAMPPQFIPSDGPEPHPWNSLLKNNYWEGSHVLELFDKTKTDVQFLLQEPRLLRNLAEQIRPFAKMSLEGLSDRIGNIVIQIPVTVISTVLNSYDKDGAFGIQPVWHPSVQPRTLRVICEKYEDTTIEGFDSKDVITEMAQFSVTAPGGGAKYVLWDDFNKVILGASAKTFFLSSIGWNVHSSSLGGNARTFSINSKDGVIQEICIPVERPYQTSFTGNSPFKPHEPWRSRRLFSNSLRELKSRKEFVQYGGNSGVDREQAIKDIHYLLRHHGADGAWLWDPYLDAEDILQTLFFNGHQDSVLRALSGGRPRPSNLPEGNEHADLPWIDGQRNHLENSKGNGYGLNLEFRVRKGHSGWDFHDRFLIFPSNSGGAIAWSLGTSINSFGHKHHILQKVQDGELIRQAFLDLWDSLSGDDHLVWKSL